MFIRTRTISIITPAGNAVGNHSVDVKMSPPSVDGRPAAYITRDAGASWSAQTTGLPDRAWFTVKRQAMTTDAEPSVGVYFGTTSGEIWASTDEGSTWRRIASGAVKS